MSRFTDINLGDEMYSVVFGTGRVIFVLAQSLRIDGYYVFQVEYNNGQKVHYTEGGIPNWCRDVNACASTIHYKRDIDFSKVDTSEKAKVLTRHKILKLRDEERLEMKSPAGAWIDADLMPDIMVENAINAGEFHLFRKIKSNG